ncbi:hypothetical protein DFJ67_1176 [Asanoa ferruginea]|uniref:Uncharacterized protein n=1 Tax=Asanoa ferruginea TaxID=53367 RepID=A0A3D9ZFD2_9ACTN|nr:DUF6650 family protein [Asanoa ferruginea]REF95224.1 hypothetical protein DFJ67_1176 [Asanoa ferruginea]GIF53475.1 hypothetical protein Afe04nite_80140 [Asanoa ferruginea]
MAKRLSGVSFPWGGIQWETVDGDKDVARRVINFLEDRRLLFGDRHMEDSMHCIRSAIEIRQMLTREMNASKPGETLEHSLRAMRAACRKFVDAAGPDAENFTRRLLPQEAGNFGLALGDLRTSIGVQIALIAEQFGLSVDEYLATILPPSDDDDASWVPGFPVRYDYE